MYTNTGLFIAHRYMHKLNVNKQLEENILNYLIGTYSLYDQDGQQYVIQIVALITPSLSSFSLFGLTGEINILYITLCQLVSIHDGKPWTTKCIFLYNKCLVGTVF